MTYTLKTVTFKAAEPQSPPIEGPTDVVRFLHAVLDDELDQDRENFLLVALNARGCVIGYKIVAIGTMTACLVHPREVFRTAIALGAHAIVVAHNHPSNDVEPSFEDAQLTKRLVDAGQLIGIPVVDHVIITADGRHKSLGGAE